MYPFYKTDLTEPRILVKWIVAHWELRLMEASLHNDIANSSYKLQPWHPDESCQGWLTPSKPNINYSQKTSRSYSITAWFKRLVVTNKIETLLERKRVNDDRPVSMGQELTEDIHLNMFHLVVGKHKEYGTESLWNALRRSAQNKAHCAERRKKKKNKKESETKSLYSTVVYKKYYWDQLLKILCLGGAEIVVSTY